MNQLPTIEKISVEKLDGEKNVLAPKGDRIDLVLQQVNALTQKVADIQKTIDKDLRLTYVNSLSKFLRNEAEDMVERLSCGYHAKTELHCKNWISKNIRGYLQNLENGNLIDAKIFLESFLLEVKGNINDIDKNMHCREDWQTIYEILTRQLDLIKDVAILFTPAEEQLATRKYDFEPSFINEKFISPLSHPIRVKIIYTLKEAPRRFTVLKDELEIKNTGLLVHHLKPLQDAGFVVQNYKKEYLLTEDGILVSKFLAQIDSQLRPTEPIRVNIEPVKIKKLKVLNK